MLGLTRAPKQRSSTLYNPCMSTRATTCYSLSPAPQNCCTSSSRHTLRADSAELRRRRPAESWRIYDLAPRFTLHDIGGKSARAHVRSYGERHGYRSKVTIDPIAEASSVSLLKEEGDLMAPAAL